MACAKPSMGRKDPSPCFHRTFGTTSWNIPVIRQRDYSSRRCVIIRAMRMIVLLLPLLVAQVPKNNPTGIWAAETGSQYEIRLNVKDLHVNIVPGLNPKFLQYEVEMKNEDEVNTYTG